MCKSSSSLTVFRMTNTGLKCGTFPVTKCEGQVCTAAKMADSFKEKFQSQWGCHMPQICSGTEGFRVTLCFLNESA